MIKNGSRVYSSPDRFETFAVVRCIRHASKSTLLAYLEANRYIKQPAYETREQRECGDTTAANKHL